MIADAKPPQEHSKRHNNNKDVYAENIFSKDSKFYRHKSKPDNVSVTRRGSRYPSNATTDAEKPVDAYSTMVDV